MLEQSASTPWNSGWGGKAAVGLRLGCGFLITTTISAVKPQWDILLPTDDINDKEELDSDNDRRFRTVLHPFICLYLGLFYLDIK